METIKLTCRHQIILPRKVRERLALVPGAKLTVLDKGGVIYLVPQKPIRAKRGIARGTNPHGLREKSGRM
jgi:AbrB family looped-hinge helix DNA binding protein